MRLGRRLARRPRTTPGPARPPDRPLGAKLELTHRCNLRCGFCYTDSPRRTIERPLDLRDERWHAIVDEAIELGVVETVLSGGEPLMRSDLTVELAERLGHAGVGVYLVTNGWFVDEQLARRLGRIAGVRVVISVDGASPSLHDGARGVPGSWRRAIHAIDALARSGVAVSVNHVVGPRNEHSIRALLEHLWLIGVASVRIYAVYPLGAAARRPSEAIGVRRIRRQIDSFQREFPNMAVELWTAKRAARGLASLPTALLVRPDGSVVIDSLRPYPLGTSDETLATCWARLVDAWTAGRLRHVDSLSSAQELAAAPAADGPATQPGPDAEPRYATGSRPARPGELGDARGELTRLALARSYRVGPLRRSRGGAQARFVRSPGKAGLVRLNETAATVLSELERRPAAAAVDRLAADHPEVERTRLERDVVGAIRALEARGLIAPADGAAAPAPEGPPVYA